MKKTVQAMKITASWSPSEETAGLMIHGTELMLLDVTITSGRLSLKTAIRAKYDDADYMARVTKRIAEIKEALGKAGELHGFNITAGSVPADEAEELPEELRLPPGSSIYGGPGEPALIVPNNLDVAAVMAYPHAAQFDWIKTEDGRVLHQPDPPPASETAGATESPAPARTRRRGQATPPNPDA